jgi:hypothetical protein
MLQHPSGIPEWQAILAHVPEQAPGLAGMDFHSVEEKLEAVAAGHGISVVPQSTARFYNRPDIACLPVTDIPDNEVRLAWAANRRSPLIAQFAELARRHPLSREHHPTPCSSKRGSQAPNTGGSPQLRRALDNGCSRDQTPHHLVGRGHHGDRCLAG